MRFLYAFLIGSFIIWLQCIPEGKYVSEDEYQIIIGKGKGIEFVLIKDGFRYSFQKSDGTILVPAHPASGLLAGSPENLDKAQNTRYLGETNSKHLFEVTMENEKRILVYLKLDGETALFQLENPEHKSIVLALRTAGVNPGYGLGDVLINRQRLPENQGRFDTEITGFVNYNFNSSSGYASRLVSNFAIYPLSQFGLINIDPGTKIVVSTKDEIIQGSRQTHKISAFYYFFGNPRDIYSNFLKARNRHGF